VHKKLISALVLSIWFFGTSRSNEKNIEGRKNGIRQKVQKEKT
jgi:hypothetical protein